MVGLDLPAGSAAARSMLSRPARASAAVRKLPSQPSASQPIRRNAAGAEPPSQMSSGTGGRVPTEAALTSKNRPRNATVSFSRTARSSCSDSSNTAARCPSGTAKTSHSAGVVGRSPNAGSTRLGASTASDANCLASRTGLRPGSTATDVPTLRRLVRPSACAMPTNGSTAGL